jgi:hypothetical protein
MALISRTVGSGGDHANWGAAIAYLVAQSPFADDYDFLQISDTVEGTQPTTYPNFNGHTVTIRNASPHGGDPTAGYKCTATINESACVRLRPTGSGFIEVKDLNIQFNCGGGGPVGVYVSGGGPDQFVHDIIAVNEQLTGYGVYNEGYGSTPSTDWITWNVITKGWDYGIYASALYNNPMWINNCTALGSEIYGIYISAASAGVGRVQNCIAESTGPAFGPVTGQQYVIAENNASNDATADDGNWKAGSANNNTSIVLANELDSTDPTNADFAKVKAGGVCEAGGLAPLITQNTLGIRGNARPHSGSYSIGADEYETAAPPSSSSSSSSAVPTEPVVVVATVPGKMPNMGRTLLLNQSGSATQSAALAAQYVPPYYTAVELPSGLMTVRRALFGSNPDRDGLNYAVWQYMRILHSTEYEDWITALDPRITYLDAPSLLDEPYGVSVSRDNAAFQFVGTPSLGGADGRLRETWNIEQIAAGVYRIMNMTTRRVETYSVSLHDGFTDFMVMTGHADYKVRIQTHLLTETTWSVESLSAPGAAMDPVNRAAQASNIGIEAYNELFPARDPYKLFKQLWEQHSLFPYKMSGYLLALIYRTEEIRSGAG